MSGLGCGLSIAAAAFGLLATVPLLGWLNWVTTLPLAVLAVVFSAVGLSRKQATAMAVLGLGGGTLVLFWAVFRLLLGGGIL